MKRLRVLATMFVVAVAALGIWVAGTGMRKGQNGGDTGDTAGAAYDYEIRDVVVQQMGADGALQYELSAQKITQEPKKGQITATELVMHRDPAGSAPGGPNRWTLRASRADLPESGDILSLQGKVHAEGRPGNSRALLAVASEQLVYNLQTQDISIDKPVTITWGSSTAHCASMRMNIRRGTVVQSKCNATYVP
jgi:LPS export ABC transporter protein LptC